MIGNSRYSTLGIGIAIHLEDYFTNPANRIAGSLSQLSDKSQRHIRQIAQDVNTVGQTLAYMGGAALYGVSQLVRQGAEFEHTMNKVRVYGDLSVQQMKKLRDEANSMAGSTIYSVNQTAKMYETLVKAGLRENQIASATKPILDFAAASDTSAESAAELLIQLSKSYGMAVEDFPRMASMLSYAANVGVISFEDFGQAFEYSQATLASLGVSMEESIALFTALADVGIRGSKAGVWIENMFRFLARGLSSGAMDKQIAALEFFGISANQVLDSQGRMKGVVDILGVLAEATKNYNLETVEAQTQFRAIFGERGSRAAMQLVNLLRQSSVKTGQSVESLVNNLNKVDPGYVTNIADEMQNTLVGSSKKFQAAFSAFAAAVTQALEPVIIPFLKVMTILLTGFTKFVSSPIGKVITAAAVSTITLVTAIGLLNMALAQFIRLRMAMDTTSMIGLIGAGPASAGGRGGMGKAGRFIGSLLGSMPYGGPAFATAASMFSQTGTTKGGTPRFRYTGVAGDFTYKNARGIDVTPKPGQFVPATAVPVGAMGPGAGKAGGGIMGRVLKFLGPFGKWLGKIGPVLGRFGGFLMGAITIFAPFLAKIALVVAALYGLYELVNWIVGGFRKKRNERGLTDEEQNQINRRVDREMRESALKGTWSGSSTIPDWWTQEQREEYQRQKLQRGGSTYGISMFAPNDVISEKVLLEGLQQMNFGPDKLNATINIDGVNMGQSSANFNSDGFTNLNFDAN